MQLDISHFQEKPGEPQKSSGQSPNIAAFDDPCHYREAGSDITILPPEDSNLKFSATRIPNGIKGLDLRGCTSRAILISMLNQNVPNGDFNLPKFIYRADLLDHTLFQKEPSADPEIERNRLMAIQDQLDLATIRLDFFEGYPSILGVPIWQKLPFESEIDYSLFQEYLRIPGARQLALVPNSTIQQLNTLFHVYYWNLRTLAYDTYALAHAERVRQQRIIQTNNSHFLLTESLLKKVESAFTNVKWDDISDPNELMGMLDKLMKLQRLALGSAASEKAPPQSPNVVTIMNTINPKQDDQLTPADQAQRGAMELLADPNLTERAQELIISYNKQ